MSRGLVMRSTGSRYVVRGADGAQHSCVAKGNLRIKGWNSTNPLAVGDHVEFTPAAEIIGNEQVGAITDLHHRKNYIVRRSVNLSHHKQVIAANLDQALLLVTLARPRTSYGFIDRFLVTAEIYRVPAIVVFNKIDDYSDEELDMLAEYDDTYQQAGYRTVITSAVKNIGIDTIRTIIAGKVTLISGHSGVGKSTLINAIQPDLDIWTFEISASSDKGQHTTTTAELIRLEFGGWVVDTPGVRQLQMWDTAAADVWQYFRDFRPFAARCGFPDCSHTHETNCAVRAAVAKKLIAERRYQSYLGLFHGVEEG